MNFIRIEDTKNITHLINIDHIMHIYETKSATYIELSNRNYIAYENSSGDSYLKTATSLDDLEIMIRNAKASR